MPGILGIPTARISDLFVRQRVLQQVQYDLSELFRLEQQLSTGHQYELPGEAPIASLRAISLQRLLERKEQAKSNLSISQSYLSATDTAMSGISGLITEVRGVALGVVGTVVTDEQRSAAVNQINNAIQQLVYAGNQKFRGRYLFAGSTSSAQAFQTLDNNVVAYLGNEDPLRSHSDVNLLTATNVTGSTAFGAISEPVRGLVDLNPILTYDTRLADLRGGEGIRPGSIVISDGSHSSIIDLSTAETIGDVARLIRANPPETRTIDVEITGTGLKIQLDPAPGDLSIREFGGGTTAYELGILTKIGVGNDQIEGTNLDPILRKTTRLDDVLGTRARAVIRSAGADNDLIIEAHVRGETDVQEDLLNGAEISFVDDATMGNEWITYTASQDPATPPTIEVHVEEGATQARHVITAINDAHAAGALPFTARMDSLDGQNGGQGLISATAAGETSGGGGIEFDRDSGLQIVHGDTTYTIDLATAETIDDVLNALNGAGAGLLAEINQTATGIDVRSRLSGVDFAIGENGGSTATHLGLRTFTEATRLADLNYGRGVTDHQGAGVTASATYEAGGAHNDLIIRAREDGTAWNDFSIEFVDLNLPPPSEAVTYDPVAKTITFEIDPLSTTAGDIVELFQATPGLRDDFEIELPEDQGVPNEGTGLVPLGSVSTAGGFTTEDFRITRADGVTFEIEINGAETIGDVIERINTHAENTPLPTGDPALVARLAAVGNGIELVDNSIGAGPLTVAGTRSNTTAVQLGLIPAGQESSTATSPGAIAIGVWDDGSDINNELQIAATSASSYYNGVTLNVHDDGGGVGNVPKLDFNPVTRILDIEIEDGITTANDVIAELANTPAVAALFTITNDGISNGTGSLDTVADFDWQSVSLSGGEPEILTGVDVHPLETEGIFTALLQLQQGLEANDQGAIERAMEMLDASVLQVNFTRAELGNRQQGLDVVHDRLESEEVELRQALSLEYDADFVEVVSNLTARQAALEAGLMATARMLQLTLLNYL